MTDLVEKLAQLRPAGSTDKLHATVIDDEFEDVGVPPLSSWIELKDTLSTSNTELLDEICQLLSDDGHNIEISPSIENLKKAYQAITTTVSEPEKEAVEKYLSEKHLLKNMSSYLASLGFSVSEHATEPPFAQGSLPFLCIVDYQIKPELDYGATATSIFTKLMELSGTTSAPPYVILMSKALTDDDVDRWAKLAEHSGFFRSNYAFLNKDNFSRSISHLEYVIRHFLHHRELTQAYYKHVNNFSIQAGVIAKKISRQLLQVTPPEALFFKAKIDKEGSSLAQEFRFIFSETLAQGIQESDELIEQTKQIEAIMSREGIPVPYRQTRSALHKLYAKWLHSSCDSDNLPFFADVFESDSQKYYLIITQECDIAKRKTGETKAKKILAIEGCKHLKLPSSSDGDAIIAKPVYDEASDTSAWLWWDLNNPSAFADADFKNSTVVIGEETRTLPPKLKKRFTLRMSHADDIQNQFASRLTRVALNLMPDFIQAHKVRIGEESTDGSFITIYELRKPSRLALAPESQALCLEAGQIQTMTPAIVQKLGTFSQIDEFNTALRTEGLLLVHAKQELQIHKLNKANKSKPAWLGSEKEPIN